jgi:regulator of protease activity HflC (stomatin/prohibitin superfamily)
MNDTEPGTILAYVVLALVLIVVVVALVKAVRIVPQAVALIVERLGRYSRTLEPGLHLLVPFVDRVRASVDLREQVVSFPPQPVITSDNLVVSIDTVIYFQVTDPKSAVYEIANYITAIEQLTVTTLRNVIGSMDLEQTLTSRDQINGQLRGVLDEATGRWGIRVNRVELKSIDPPPSVQGSMEQQMRAERDRRAAILTAEGVKQSQVLTAEGEKQAAILRAEGDAQSQILRAEGESRAILQVFDAIHEGDADPKLLAYQYLQMLPQIANGTASKLWVVPTEFTAALGSIAQGFGAPGAGGGAATGDETSSGPDEASLAARRQRDRDRERLELGTPSLTDPAEALAEARRQAEAATAVATSSGTRSGLPFDPQSEAGQHPGGEGQRSAVTGAGAPTPRPLGGEPASATPPAPPTTEDEPPTGRPRSPGAGR